jgi:DNA replication and repair protein RecF
VYDLDGKILRRLSLDHTLPVVLFEPNHLSLLTGSPEQRRDYLDDLLSQTITGYSSTIRSFRRTLAQRNKLLKNIHVRDDELFPWNVRLSELAGVIVRARMQLVGSIDGKIGELYKDLSHGDVDVSIRYRSSANPDHYETVMLQQLEAKAHDDLLRGFTSFGPHREDIEVLFAGRAAEEVASRGETRTFVLGLKIIELETLQEKRNKTPLLLLDDVFSELDGARRKALTAHLQPFQTFITTTDADVVTQHFAEHSNIILVSR